MDLNLHKFTVLIAFDNYAEGDVVIMNDRQAKYHILSGALMPHNNRLLDAVTAPVTGDWVRSNAKTFQATVTGTGAVAATVEIEFSNDQVGAIRGGIEHDGTITLSGTDLASDGFKDDQTYLYKRARLTAISGTDAVFTATMDA